MLKKSSGYYTSRFIAYEHLLQYFKESDETHIDTVNQELMNAKNFSRQYTIYVKLLFTKTGLPNDLKENKILD